MKKILWYTVTLITTALLCACNGEKPPYQPPSWDKNVYPSTEWTTAGFEDFGYNSNTGDALNTFLASGSNNVTGLVVIIGGKQVYSYGNTSETSYLASARKSILAMMYGKYVENGTIDLNRTLDDLIINGVIRNDVQALLPIERQATILNCITARSGVHINGSNTGDDRAFFQPRGSMIPGTYYLYNNWDFNVSGSIFEGLTGKDIYDAFGEDLAVPLQFQDWFRNRQVKGGTTSISVYRAYHFYLSARDMARLGYLMLRNGKWNNDQLIPATWCSRSTKAFTPLGEMNPASRRSGNFGYGYMWWVWDGTANTGAYKGAYMAQGAGGQYIVVLPALDMVIAQKRDANILTAGYSNTNFLRFLSTLISQQTKPYTLN